MNINNTTSAKLALSVISGSFALASAVYYQDRFGGAQSGLMAGIATVAALLCFVIILKEAVARDEIG